MAPFEHPMQIFQHLNKSNCRDCGSKTCLAFAAAVFQGDKSLTDCPHIDPSVLAELEKDTPPTSSDEARPDMLDTMKAAVGKTDLSQAAKRIGGIFDGRHLMFKILGKPVRIDTRGDIHTDIHVNPWIASPVYRYILYGEGLDLTGKWVSLRELPGGRERYPLFRQRCEYVLKGIADHYPDLFSDLTDLLNGRSVDPAFQSDISVLMPLFPKVPLMICYWAPEDGMESRLNLFFDGTAEKNLDIEGLFALGAGLTQMLSRMAQTHGYAEQNPVGFA